MQCVDADATAPILKSLLALHHRIAVGHGDMRYCTASNVKKFISNAVNTKDNGFDLSSVESRNDERLTVVLPIEPPSDCGTRPLNRYQLYLATRFKVEYNDHIPRKTRGNM